MTTWPYDPRFVSDAGNSVSLVQEMHFVLELASPPLNHFVLWLVSFSMFHQLSEVAGTQAEANLSCNFIARKASILQSVLQYQQTMTIPWLKMGPKRFFFGCRALASIGPQENSGLLRYTETSVWPNSCQRSYVATKDGSIHCSWWRPTIGMESSESLLLVIAPVGDTTMFLSSRSFETMDKSKTKGFFAEKPQVLLGSPNKSSNLPVVALWRRTCLASCTLVAAARRKKVLLSHLGHEVGPSSLPMNSPKSLLHDFLPSNQFFLTPFQVIQIVQSSATTAKFFDLSLPPHQLHSDFSQKVVADVGSESFQGLQKAGLGEVWIGGHVGSLDHPEAVSMDETWWNFVALQEDPPWEMTSVKKYQGDQTHSPVFIPCLLKSTSLTLRGCWALLATVRWLRPSLKPALPRLCRSVFFFSHMASSPHPHRRLLSLVSCFHWLLSLVRRAKCRKKS